jgi:hypothetical protein
VSDARIARFPHGPSIVRPTLVRAQAATIGKAQIEVPDLQRIGAIDPGQVPLDDAAWTAIGRRVWNLGGPAPQPRVLDATSRALVAALHNGGPAAHTASPAELAAVITRLEEHIMADTALNQFALRQSIRWRIVIGADLEFEKLNAWIYDQVFATPRNDAWLGLLPRTDFTGLPGDGVVMPLVPAGRAR